MHLTKKGKEHKTRGRRKVFFNIYLQNWREVPSGGVIGNFRILSNDQNGSKAEVYGFGVSPVFIQGEGSVFTLII